MDDKYDKEGGWLHTYAGTPSAASFTDVLALDRRRMSHSHVGRGFPEPVVMLHHRQ